MEAIDVEEESVLTAIFKDAFPEIWQNDPNFVLYLSELSSYGVEKLAQQPDRLAEEKAQILEDTQTLAFQNYKTFIETAECSKEIFEDFQIIEHHVEDLLQKLPEFSEHCGQVLKKAQDISSSRRMNTLTLQRHTQLLEILELPQLMDTCVRNCYYDEALELAAHVKRLEKKHSSIPVIASIVGEVKASTQLMLNQLIQQLRTNVQLPACLRVIGYLRRMDVFTEAELRIKFLQARDAWFQGILENVPKEDAYTHITKTIEASRVNLFDIITQYRAIFSDEDPLLATSKDDALNESALFHGWIVQKVSQFLSILESDLRRGLGGRLDSILGQCMYFGLSFSRVGADFRGLLTPIFQRAALDSLLIALVHANKRFEENMRSYSLLTSSPSMGSGLPYNPSSQTALLYPPTVLMDFHPLAAYCNDVLSALNDLRLCAPVALVMDVANALRDSFINVNKIILAFHRAEETTFDRREKERFDEFCSAYAHSLIPYINKCLQALYPVSQLAQVLGVSVSDIHKMGNLGQIDVKSVLNSVQHLIPEVEEVAPPPDEINQSEPSKIDQSLASTAQTASTVEPVKVPTSQSDSGIQAEHISADQSDKVSQSEHTGTEHVETIVTSPTREDQDQTSAETEDVTPETGSQHVDMSNNSVPNPSDADKLGAKKVVFSLSDTEEEINLDDVGVDGGDGEKDAFDIDSDLSALAADVLGAKSTDSGSDMKKND